ncbi:putative ORFan [Tupanvirus deep ocean]|uniref:ORFan n=1 Tax=Tupanvirus soda lake TaxID=2126985 RepID=A0A2K9L2U2_9VIRU|nr:putative ORFan [Tupanvirus deep ocean]AUL79821.2 putative ORFan [Tupanvirus deep ocean]
MNSTLEFKFDASNLVPNFRVSEYDFAKSSHPNSLSELTIQSEPDDLPDVPFSGVNLGLSMRQGTVSGGNFGSYGGGGNNGSNGGNSGARYVERMGADGKVWGTCTNSNGAVAWTGYKATNPNNMTQQYYKPMTGGSTHHTTLHRDGTYNVHHTNGTKSVYK